MKRKNRNSIIRNRILKILSIPTGVSELKEQIKEVSSFGTIAYHLKELESEGLISKYKQEKKRGQPTKYFLTSLKKNPKKMIEYWKKREKLIIKNTLLFLKENLNSTEEQIQEYLINKIKLVKYSGEGDIVFNLIVNSNYVKPIYKLTPEGEKFLKENEN